MKKNHEEKKREDIEPVDSTEDTIDDNVTSEADTLTSRLEDTKKEVDSLKEELLVSKADLINTISRMRKEGEKTVTHRENAILVDFLNIVEYFNAGIDYGNSIKDKNKDLDNLLLGFRMVETQLANFLSSKSISKFDALNCYFDPKKHMPSTVIHSDDCTISTVTKQFTSGYSRGDTVIRLASVEVTSPALENKENKNNNENIDETQTKV